MKEFKNIKNIIFDCDGVLYKDLDSVFGRVSKRMGEYISKKLNVDLKEAKGKEKVANMIKVASLTRKGFMVGDISTVMSPRTVLFWAENSEIFKDTSYAFRVTFLNKCEDVEKNIIAEYYQRCFGEDLPESLINTQI